MQLYVLRNGLKYSIVLRSWTVELEQNASLSTRYYILHIIHKNHNIDIAHYMEPTEYA